MVCFPLSQTATEAFHDFKNSRAIPKAGLAVLLIFAISLPMHSFSFFPVAENLSMLTRNLLMPSIIFFKSFT